jgi:MinD-like ATPase involved in chromosome partitioning or flagellar assembly
MNKRTHVTKNITRNQILSRANLIVVNRSSRTEAGKRMCLNLGQSAKAFDSIRVSFESDSDVNDESDEQPLKHFVQITSTEDGIQIDCNDEQ